MQTLIITIAHHLSAYVHQVSDKVDSFKPLIAFVIIKLFAVFFITLGQMDHIVSIAGAVIMSSIGIYRFWYDHKSKGKSKKDETN